MLGFFVARKQDGWETIRYDEDVNAPLHDRGIVFVFEDPKVFARAESKKLILSQFTDQNTHSVRFTTDAISAHLLELQFGSVFVFGSRCDELAKISRPGHQPGSVYVVFPDCPPPQHLEIGFFMGAILRAGDNTNDVNALWKQWCVRNRVPFVAVNSTDIMTTREAFHSLGELIREAIRARRM